MFNVVFVQHNKLTPSLMQEIIKVKCIAWPYNYNEHLKWIENNLNNSDIHVLLYQNERILAYLNLVEISIQFDGCDLQGFGIGNVCAAEKGQGWGGEIISRVNQFLLKNDLVGLLFCKEGLVKFYTENRWERVNEAKLDILKSSSEINVLVFNPPFEFENIRYQGDLF